MVTAVAKPITERAAAVHVRIRGGLGNQMFQYAAARALALRHDCRVAFDLSFFDRPRNRRFELDRFPIQAQWKAPSLRRLPTGRLLRSLRCSVRGSVPYREPSEAYDPAFQTLEPPVDLTGYFFSDKYFEHESETIRRELQPPAATDAASRDIQAQMSCEESTSLHIRRGDYVSAKKPSERFWVCTLDYYRRAMERVGGDGPVFVFSDDIPWAKENLRAERRLVFVEADPAQDGLRDLWLMTHARHHIIANSSFSWWGAWLAGGHGVKVAPDMWYRDPAINTRDIVPDAWLRL